MKPLPTHGHAFASPLEWTAGGLSNDFTYCFLFFCTVPISIDVKTGPGISKDLRVFLSCKKIILYKAGMNKREKEETEAG